MDLINKNFCNLQRPRSKIVRGDMQSNLVKCVVFCVLNR